jgi:hypothetical protein
MNMEDKFFSETSIDFQRTTRCYITENRILQLYIGYAREC